MRRLYIVVMLILLVSFLLAACEKSEPELTTTAVSFEPELTATAVSFEPELTTTTVSFEPELTEINCVGKIQIGGGDVVITVTTEAGNLDGIGRAEFFVDDSLLHTVTEPPFSFTVDTSVYEDDTLHTFKTDVYDTSDVLHQSESIWLLVDNTIDPNLRPLAEASGIEIGTPIMAGANYTIQWNDRLYMATICQNFSLIVADYGMYMDNLHPSSDVWRWSQPDLVVDFAEENGLRIRGHPLIWGINLRWTNPGEDWTPTPLWVHEGNRSREEMIDIMYEYIDTVMSHYQGRVQEWVVVNEPVDGTQPGELARNVWTEGIGEDYIELAFRRARQVDPDAVLIINEFDADYPGQLPPEEPYKYDNYYNLVAELLEKGTPIDAVGLQFHLIVGQDHPTVEAIVDNFARYGALGLEVYVTEMDVRIEKPATQDDLEEQARLYATVLQACLESEFCTSFTVWGQADKYNTAIDPEWEAPALFDQDIQPKPAFYSVLEVMEAYSK